MIERLVLHVGLHKTGTTSLQHYLAHKSSSLKADRVLYPKTGQHCWQHSLIAGYCIENHPFLPSKRERSFEYYTQNLLCEAEEAKASLVIISSEVFTERLGNENISDMIRNIRILKSIFERIDILITTREARMYALSAVKHMARESVLLECGSILYPNIGLDFQRHFKEQMSYPEWAQNKWKQISKDLALGYYELKMEKAAGNLVNYYLRNGPFGFGRNTGILQALQRDQHNSSLPKPHLNADPNTNDSYVLFLIASEITSREHKALPSFQNTTHWMQQSNHLKERADKAVCEISDIEFVALLQDDTFPGQALDNIDSYRGELGHKLKRIAVAARAFSIGLQVED